MEVQLGLAVGKGAVVAPRTGSVGRQVPAHTRLVPVVKRQGVRKVTFFIIEKFFQFLEIMKKNSKFLV